MKRPRPLEHSQQRLLFEWAKLHEKKYPELKLMFAIPNGGDRHPVVGAKLKAEGVKAGVPDIFLPCARWQNFASPDMLPAHGLSHGLFVEMKRDAKEKPSKEQEPWIGDLRRQGYRVEIGYGFDDAKAKILAYLTGQAIKEGE